MHSKSVSSLRQVLIRTNTAIPREIDVHNTILNSLFTSDLYAMLG